MDSWLRKPLTAEQQVLLGVIGEPFIGSGSWPIWQYVDITLEDRHGLDAVAVLASLPDAGDRSPVSPSYGLVWRPDPYRQPRLDDVITLTVAGLWHLPQARPLVGAFLTMIQYLVDRQRGLVPSPHEVVTATVASGEIAEQLRETGIPADGSDGVEAMLPRLRVLLDHEPFLHAVVHQPTPADPWTVRVPPVLRGYREVATAEEYIDKVTELVAPPAPPSVPPSIGALDLPYSVGYLDAVWQTRTGVHLFVNLDPASIARLTLACGSEEEFNSLMSALADVLGQVVAPGSAAPPQRGALEAVRGYLTAALGPDAADRADAAFETLICLRRIRVSTQHSDARHRAVASFTEIGLTFPPSSWDEAWAYIARLAMGALDVLREEVHVGLSR